MPESVRFSSIDLLSIQSKLLHLKIKSYGLYEKMGTYNDTGVVFFFHAETKELISKISVAKSDRQLAEAVQMAKED